MKRIFLITLFLGTFLTAFGAFEYKTGSFEFAPNKKGYIFFPENYTPGMKCKFILFMHGRGYKPGNPGNFGQPPFTNFRQMCSDKGYIVAVPQAHARWFNDINEVEVDEMLDFLRKKLQMPLKRFHVMGGSMGGHAALMYAGKNSEKVISVCDFFGGVNVFKLAGDERFRKNLSDVYGGSVETKKSYYNSRNAVNYASVYATLPMLIIHGVKDVLVPIEHSRELVGAIRKIDGSNLKYIEDPAGGHTNEIIRGKEQLVFDFFAAAEKSNP